MPQMRRCVQRSNNAAGSGRLELAQLCGGRSFDATEGVGRLVRAK